MSFADARGPSAEAGGAFLLAVAGSAGLTALAIVLLFLSDGVGMDLAALPMLFAAAFLIAAAIVALAAAPIGAVPGSICGAIWWWTHRRHLQGIAA